MFPIPFKFISYQKKNRRWSLILKLLQQALVVWSEEIAQSICVHFGEYYQERALNPIRDTS